MKLTVFVALLIGLANPVFAQQTQEETVVVRKSDLTAEQLAKVQSSQIKEKLSEYSEYADMGKGIGIAVGESLKGVKDVTIELSNTDVGRMTMFLIAWKVMAKDVIDMGDKVFGYFIGIPFLALSLSLCALSYYRQCVPRRVVVEKGPGLWAWRSKKYQVFDPAKREGEVLGQDDLTFVHAVAAIVLVILGSIMTFGC